MLEADQRRQQRLDLAQLDENLRVYAITSSASALPSLTVLHSQGSDPSLDTRKPIEEENTDHVVGADYVRDDVAQILWGELEDVAIALGTDDQSLLDHVYHPKAL
jgi:hypothetical protein